jgi:hypothetical protein
MRHLILSLLIAGAATAAESGTLTIFDDTWQNGWFEAGQTGDPLQKDVVHEGKAAIEVMMDAQNSIFNCFNTKVIPVENYGAVSFWAHGSDDGGQNLKVYLRQLDGEKDVATVIQTLKPLVKEEWQLITIPLDEFKAKGGTGLNSVMFQGDQDGSFWLLDDLALVPVVVPPAAASPTAPAMP